MKTQEETRKEVLSKAQTTSLSFDRSGDLVHSFCPSCGKIVPNLSQHFERCGVQPFNVITAPNGKIIMIASCKKCHATPLIVELDSHSFKVACECGYETAPFDVMEGAINTWYVMNKVMKKPILPIDPNILKVCIYHLKSDDQLTSKNIVSILTKELERTGNLNETS